MLHIISGKARYEFPGKELSLNSTVYSFKTPMKVITDRKRQIFLWISVGKMMMKTP